MTWFGWFMVVELFVSAAVRIYQAGQGPTVRTPGNALVVGIEMAVMGVLVLTVGTGSL